MAEILTFFCCKFLIYNMRWWDQIMKNQESSVCWGIFSLQYPEEEFESIFWKSVRVVLEEKLDLL